MTFRSDSAVIVRVETVNHDGKEGKTYYGPFLPHAGAATTAFIRRINDELEEAGRYSTWVVEVEPLFIAANESDCVVQATR